MRQRRPPPPFRVVAVERVEDLSPRLLRVTLGGSELQGLAVEEPAASVRVLIPGPNSETLFVPEWNGNEFLLPDGSRPIIRTFTPGLRSADDAVLHIDVVQHPRGAVARWAAGARPGDAAAVSGPGRGYAEPEVATGYLLLGDETAIPAIRQLLAVIEPEIPTDVHIEVVHADARLADLEGGSARVVWHYASAGQPPGSALVEAVKGAELHQGVKVWAAGEAASMQSIRRYLFEDADLARADATIRGYWKRRA